MEKQCVNLCRQKVVVEHLKNSGHFSTLFLIFAFYFGGKKHKGKGVFQKPDLSQEFCVF